MGAWWHRVFRLLISHLRLSKEISEHSVYFRKNDSYMYRLSGPLFHFTVPTSRWTVYHEVTTGPFTKRKTVEYAKFSPDENASLDEINKFLSKYKIKNYEK